MLKGTNLTLLSYGTYSDFVLARFDPANEFILFIALSSDDGSDESAHIRICICLHCSH